jgi:predicted membrane protein
MSDDNYEENIEKRKSTKQETRRNNRRNDGDGIGVGITLIFVGIIWMLDRLNWIDFSIINSISTLWPLILVVIGVNMIFRKRYVKILTWSLFLIALLAYGIIFPYNNFNFEFKFGDMSMNVADEKYIGKYISESKYSEDDKTYKDGMFELNIPAGNIEISGMESKGIKYVVPDFMVDNSLMVLTEDNGSILANFQPEDKFLENNWRDDYNYKFDFELGSETQWEVKINAGASEANLDFSNVNLKKLDINTGAGEINLKVGNLNDAVEVYLNSGVSEVDIKVPKGSGVELETNGIIAKDGLKRLGFEKYNGRYYSKNYEETENKVKIEVNSIIAEISVEYY